MTERLDGGAVGAGIVRILAGIVTFIANDRIVDADFEIETVADRCAQGDIGLANGEVIRSSTLGDAVVTAEEGGILTKPELDFVARRPRRLIEWFLNLEIHHV